MPLPREREGIRARRHDAHAEADVGVRGHDLEDGREDVVVVGRCVVTLDEDDEDQAQRDAGGVVAELRLGLRLEEEELASRDVVQGWDVRPGLLLVRHFVGGGVDAQTALFVDVGRADRDSERPGGDIPMAQLVRKGPYMTKVGGEMKRNETLHHANGEGQICSRQLADRDDVEAAASD